MNKSIILLLLCTFAFATDEEFFNKISQDDFGKTIIQTIQVTLNQNGQNTLGRVQELLKQMQQDINDEEQSESQQLQQRISQFNGRVEETQKVIDVAAQRKAEDERNAPILQEQLRDKERQQNAKLGEEQRNNDRIAALTEARRVSRAEYEERRDELSQIVGALKEARKIIEQLKSSSFVQIGDHILTQLKQHHQKFLNNFPKQRGFHGLINVLLVTLQDKQVHSNQESVKKLLDVIDELVESVFEVQKEEMKADDQRQQDYLNQKARIELLNRRLEQSVAELRAAVQILTQKALELDNDIATQQSVIEVKTKERNDWQRTAVDAQQSFNRLSEYRKQQLEIIVQCLQIFEQRADTASEFVQKIHIH